MLQLILGFIIGGIFGFAVCAVCCINRVNSDRLEFKSNAENTGDSDAE